MIQPCSACHGSVADDAPFSDDAPFPDTERVALGADLAKIQTESGWQLLPSPWRRPLAWLLLLPIRAYRRWLTRWLPPACRFHPSCSHYAVVALAQHRAPVAIGLIGWRLLRCQPLCRGGVDWPRPGPYAASAPSSLPSWPALSETDRP